MASSQTLDGNSIGPYINLTNGVVATYQTFTGLVAAGYTNVSGNLTSTTNATLQSYSVSAPAALTTLKTYIGQSMSNVNVVALITQITLLADNTASIYGRWRDGAYLPSAPPAPPPPPPTPTGGVITTDGLYTLHTFLTSGTFTTFAPLTCTVLLVGGGGGGGGLSSGGGGGAGQYAVVSKNLTLAQAHPIVVGGGGNGGTPGTQDGQVGGNTTGFSETAVGGCFGQGDPAGDMPSNYGNGGGGSATNGSGGSPGNPGGQSSIGNVGGAGLNGQTVNTGGGGGGGGSAVVGGNAFVNGPDVKGGQGGSGNTVPLIGAIAYNLCGGGAGGGAAGGDADPGFGGGNGGVLQQPGVAATPNTGGGGGGGGALGLAPGVQTTGGAGGSGLVVVAYLTPA